MKLHALAGRSKKGQVVVNGEVGCASLKNPARLHICIFIHALL